MLRGEPTIADGCDFETIQAEGRQHRRAENIDTKGLCVRALDMSFAQVLILYVCMYVCMYVRDENLFCFDFVLIFCIYSPFEALLAILLSSSFVHWIDFGLCFTISVRSKIPLDT